MLLREGHVEIMEGSESREWRVDSRDVRSVQGFVLVEEGREIMCTLAEMEKRVKGFGSIYRSW